MSNFKVGDYVSSSKFAGVKKITKDVNDLHDWFLLDGSAKKYYKNELTLVCGFVKNQEVYVSNFDKEFQCKNVSIFEEYRPDLSYPFVVKTRYKEGFALESYKFARSIPKKEYKAYEEFNTEWIGGKRK